MRWPEALSDGSAPFMPLFAKELRDLFAGRGHDQARLRMMAENTDALRFYERHGWRQMQGYPHEINSSDMIDMVKSLTPISTPVELDRATARGENGRHHGAHLPFLSLALDQRFS